MASQYFRKNSRKLSSDNVKDSQQILAARKIQRAYRNYVQKLNNGKKDNQEIQNVESAEIEYNDSQVENKEKDIKIQNNEKKENSILIIQRAFRLYSQRKKLNKID